MKEVKIVREEGRGMYGSGKDWENAKEKKKNIKQQ